MVSTHTLFEWLVGLHIATGAVGLIVVWIPIAGKKGGATSPRRRPVRAIDDCHRLHRHRDQSHYPV